MRNFIILAFCCTLFHVTAVGYHIIGGEIFYEFVRANPDGKYSYVITLKLYRNADFTCGEIQGCLDHFENPIPLNIYTSEGIRVSNAILLYIKETRPLRDTLKNPCLAPRTQNLEVAFYQDTIALRPISGGYYIAYQRCCRGQKLANIYNSEHEGSTFYTMIPGTESRPANNSVHFNKDAAIVICANLPFTYDYAAYDADGDSLTYSLCNALTGGTTRNEVASADPPPYNTTVSYISPYSGENPMGGSPQVTINNKGFLHGTPYKEGQFVVSVCVSEYDRKTRQLIGTHHKDILLTVFNCYTSIKAGFPSLLKNCVADPDLSVLIPNSSNAGYTSSYYWDFGDGTDTITYDRKVFPHQYPDTGVYKVKLVVNPGLTCTDSTTGIVSNYPGLHGDFSTTGLCKGSLIEFDDHSSYTYGHITDYRWDLGLRDDTISSLAYGIHAGIIYNKGGVYTVTLSLFTDHQCTATITKDVTIYEVIPFAGNDTILSRGQPLQLHATGGDFYNWSPPEGLSNTGLADPMVNWNQDISYTLAVSDMQGCIGYDTIHIKYYTGPDIYVPNAFSPNGDGQNDRFRFIPVGITEYKYFRIFNRWGQEIYSSTDFRNGWNGTIKGAPAPVDTYIWILEGKDFTGKTILRKGTVTLVK
ncbi:gliding motility-associated C-terminal domain-containing protein [Chitinophaga sp. CF118]|uniref:T9SS type B sorting domain-containing protein n=1 Tax=Chitinophaga sp. CF118 TaxID=1884367 RepID=UPI0008E6FC38|nr:gliding motility-associated C-terminal domain-containing protein [Chitinophaga sp. CF118]SFD12239.1 gliding motility-associated C-terminal domain-containing protein [Chitinophaga sp. CF118]